MSGDLLTAAEGRVTIHVADVFDALREIGDETVDCCITSPPYWGLRDYGVEGQIGLEPTLGEHLDVMVDVFAQVHRVLKPGGMCFVNYGDCYATEPNGRSAAETKAHGADDRTFRDKPFSTAGPIYGARPGEPFEPANGSGRRGGGNAHAGVIFEQSRETADRRSNGKQSSHAGQADHGGRVVAGGTLKPTDLCMVPNRLAIVLQEWGWFVRSEIVWGKTNPMPDSSGRYRPSTSHEKIWLLAKSDKPRWWSARDTGELSDAPDLNERIPNGDGKSLPRWIGHRHYWDAEAVRIGRRSARDEKMPDGWDTGPGAHGTFHRQGRERGQGADKQRGHSRRHDGFNDRWDHMSDAEQRPNGRFLRNFESAPLVVWEMATRPFSEAHFATFPPELVERALAAGCPKGGHVLDPFGGAGTTGLIAAARGYTATLIELNAKYATMARDRIDDALLGDLARLTRKLGEDGEAEMFGGLLQSEPAP